MRSLYRINRDYERILHNDDFKYKTPYYAALMSELEATYQVPAIRNEAWEKENRAVIALYRKISRSRTM